MADRGRECLSGNLLIVVWSYLSDVVSVSLYFAHGMGICRLWYQMLVCAVPCLFPV